MRAEPGFLQEGGPSSVLQEPLRGAHDVRGGPGPGAASGGLQGLQLLRPGVQGTMVKTSLKNSFFGTGVELWTQFCDTKHIFM